MMRLKRSTLLFILICGVIVSGAFNSFPLGQSPGTPAVDVTMVNDEAEAVLAILAKRQAQQPINEGDWQRLFTSEGYVRLKRREAAMQRPFADTDFKNFVLSDALAGRAQVLAETLDKWKCADITRAAQGASAYLPKEARLKTKIYPVIKPQENSFVFEVETDPAIFLYLDPSESKEKFENKLAHELHHIGYGSSCPAKQTAAEISKLPQNTQTVLNWIGAFGEGFAMLAAAGGPDIHPHAVSSAEDRARWDHDMANFNEDLKKVEKLFLDVLEGRLKDQSEIEIQGFSFFGVQGPWYTVGWKMSVVIEKTYGRAKLIECICDQRKLLPTYNEAAAKINRDRREPLALWSPSVIGVIGVGQKQKPSLPASFASYKIADIMPSFWQFWEQSQTLDETAKIHLFRELVVQPNKRIFETMTGMLGKSDEVLSRYFVKLQPYIPAMQRFYERLATELPPAAKSFKKKFPDANGSATIYFMPNGGDYDAGAGGLPEGTVLVFGVDAIAKLKKEGFNLAPLLHHEIFHLYHDQFHREWDGRSRAKGEIPLYWLMWSEGLATYVSKVLNPKASTDDILLPDELIRSTEQQMPRLVKELRENLDSTSTDGFMNFLSGRPTRPDIPPRCGYYIGMLVARELNRKHSLRELARLRDPQLRKEIEVALIKIESRYSKPSRP